MLQFVRVALLSGTSEHVARLLKIREVGGFEFVSAQRLYWLRSFDVFAVPTSLSSWIVTVSLLFPVPVRIHLIIRREILMALHFDLGNRRSV
jgi:hypothetical protein